MSSRRTSWQLAVACAVIAFAAACARPQLPAATPADAARAVQRYPGTTVADLQAGRELYVARCASCHQPVQPHAIAPEDWPDHVIEMQERSHLDDAQASLVERYLVTMSERSRVARR